MKVYKSSFPIVKINISQSILDFFYDTLEENQEIFKNNNFSIEFLLFEDLKGFCKFSSSNEIINNQEIILLEKDLSDLITKLKETDTLRYLLN